MSLEDHNTAGNFLAKYFRRSGIISAYAVKLTKEVLQGRVRIECWSEVFEVEVGPAGTPLLDDLTEATRNALLAVQRPELVQLGGDEFPAA